MITNEEVEIVRLRGYLEGLNYRYNSLVGISKNPLYKSDLKEEIEKVLTEIKEVKNKLND
jgi:predicted DNA-binding protein (UPF0251 family)